MNIIDEEINIRENERTTYSNNISGITEGHVKLNEDGTDYLDIDSFDKSELEDYKFWTKQELIAEIKKNMLLEFLDKKVTEERGSYITSSMESLIDRLRSVDPNSVLADYVNIKDKSEFLNILDIQYPAISIEGKSSDEIVETYMSYIKDACEKKNITSEQLESIANDRFSVKNENVIHM